MRTLQEIADAMGISKQMVYKIEQRALRKAKALMEEQGLTMQEILQGENKPIREKQKGERERTVNNPVAKYGRRFNKAQTMRDSYKEDRKGYRKHKGVKDYE